MSTLRLFVDPGSKVSGWALFEDKHLVETGTCRAVVQDTGDRDAFRRLSDILDAFALPDFSLVKEVHIEQLVTRTHQYTHWAVGAIGALLAAYGIPVRADVPISSWQKFVGWKKLKQAATQVSDVVIAHPELRRLQRAAATTSLDAVAAAGMGFYWMSEKVGFSKSKPRRHRG